MNVRESLAHIFTLYQGQSGTLIPILQKTQEELGYLSEEAISEIAHFLGVSKSQVYGVASFYAQFRFTRQGEHVVKVCQGTACHVRGSHRILEEVETKLGIKLGETTEDYKFSLERVACVGCCALAPVMILDDTVHAKVAVSEAKKILDSAGEAS